MLIGVIAEELLLPLGGIRESASASDLITPTRVLASTVTEAAAANDTPTTGVVFAALVDDPASANDHVEARVGELMAEAAVAADSFTAGLAGISARSAMVAGPWLVFVNPGASRQANTLGVMINL